MPTNITFLLHRNYKIVNSGGLVTAQPALEAAARLYAIHNNDTDRPVYIGTAANLKHRFTERISSLRELGFSDAAINSITIHAYRVLVNDIPRPPDNTGHSQGFDVEHLLICLHLARFIHVRNINKAGGYYNSSGDTITLTLRAEVPLAVPTYLGGAIINDFIPKNTAY
jgi:hypothetical protein